MKRQILKVCVIASAAIWVCACQDYARMRAGYDPDGNRGISSAGGDAGDSGSSNAGDAGSIVEYRGCTMDGAVSCIVLYRIDRTNSICTMVWIEENFGTSVGPSINCEPLGLVSGPACLSSASVSVDVAACETRLTTGNAAVQAIAVTGTFTVSGSVVDIDVELEFPSGGSLPETVHMQATNCAANCTADDCRLSDELLCEATGGQWDLSSCGHYWCGQPPECDGYYPGCDCGPERNFITGVGCQDDPECP